MSNNFTCLISSQKNVNTHEMIRNCIQVGLLINLSDLIINEELFAVWFNENVSLIFEIC